MHRVVKRGRKIPFSRLRKPTILTPPVAQVERVGGSRRGRLQAAISLQGHALFIRWTPPNRGFMILKITCPRVLALRGDHTVPFIIWGSRGIESTVHNGDFYCPSCDQQGGIQPQAGPPFFTSTSSRSFQPAQASAYVECHGCKKTYKEGVLEYKPPSESQRALGRLYEELVSGTSVNVVQRSCRMSASMRRKPRTSSTRCARENAGTALAGKVSTHR